MNRKYSINDLSAFSKQRGFELLSTAYTSCNDKYKWQCSKCNHIWKATWSNIKNHRSGCPSCAGFGRTVKDMKILAAKKGFKFLSASYEGMKKPHKWGCPNMHEWYTAPFHIREGTGCPHCTINIAEEKCRFIFETLTGKKFPSNSRVLENRLQLDGYCEELNLAFEYQGIQHYQTIPHWHQDGNSLEDQKKRDLKKHARCIEKGICKIDIPFTVNKSDELESFTKEQMKNHDIEFLDAPIDWNKFNAYTSRLIKVKESANNIGLECLSDVYLGARTKLKFKCLKCDDEFESRPYNIKSGYGCRKCSYTHKRWLTRRKRQLDKII